MKRFRSREFIVVILIALVLGYMFRGLFFKNKILFPSNFLASFYAPWSTNKFPQFPNGIPNKPIGGNDQVRMFYPYRTFINESIKRGELPLWNPYNFSGGPILANFQSAIFYPFNILYLLLPQITAWSFLVVLQPILGTLFMYMFLKIFIERKSAAFLGAFSFGFSGFILAWSQENAVVGQTALWLPAVLYTTERLVQYRHKKYFILLVLATASCFFAGHYQVAFYVFSTALCYGATRAWQQNAVERKQSLLLLLSAYAAMLLLCAIQLIPSIEAFTQSPRSSVSPYPIIKAYLMPVTHFIVALAPDILGNPGSYNYFGRGFYQESAFVPGIILLIFTCVAIARRRENSIVYFFTILLGITYLFGVDSPFTRWFNQLPIPVITTFTPSRIFFLTSAAISILGAFGFNYWLNEDSKKDQKIVYGVSLIAGVAIVVTVALFYFSVHLPNQILANTVEFLIKPSFQLKDENVKVSLRNSILPLLTLIFLCISVFIKKWITFVPVFLIVVACAGQLYFYNKYLVIGEKSLLYPDNFIFTDIQKHQKKADRFLSFGTPILGDVNLEKHTYSPDGIDPVFSNRYGELVYVTKNEGKFNRDIPRIEANLSEYGENLNIINNNHRLRLMSLLGVTRVYNYEPSYKNLNDMDKIFPPDSFVSVWQREGWHAYENKQAFPRVFLADKYIIETDQQKSIDIILSSSTDLHRTIVLEEKPNGLSESTTGTEGHAEITKYTPQKIEIKVTTDQSRLLFLSDNYYPGWNAYRGNDRLKIYRADYAFRAIVVPKGSHTITFLFQPVSVTLGLSLSIIMALTLLLIWLKKPKPVSGLIKQ